VLVHLAGQGSFRCFIDEDADAMEQMLRTNCASAMWLAQAVLPQMTARGDGQLVFAARCWVRSRCRATPCMRRASLRCAASAKVCGASLPTAASA